jgi:uncharacterized protein YqgV (UPF0045/DUF77 family)
MIVELQVLPTPSGTPEDRHAHVEAAIAVIQSSGLHQEVGPLGTSLEGPPDQVWDVLRRAHEATLAAGADRVISVVKLAQGTGDQGPAMDDLTRKFR